MYSVLYIDDRYSRYSTASRVPKINEPFSGLAPSYQLMPLGHPGIRTNNSLFHFLFKTDTDGSHYCIPLFKIRNCIVNNQRHIYTADFKLFGSNECSLSYCILNREFPTVTSDLVFKPCGLFVPPMTSASTTVDTAGFILQKYFILRNLA